MNEGGPGGGDTDVRAPFWSRVRSSAVDHTLLQGVDDGGGVGAGAGAGAAGAGEAAGAAVQDL